MKTIGIVSAVAIVLCLSVFSRPARAQCPASTKCPDNSPECFLKMLGSGLDSIHSQAMHFHDSIVRSKIEALKHSADSIKKEVRRLKDSLNYEGGGNLGEMFRKFDFRNFGDSFKNFADSMKQFQFHGNTDFFRVPNSRRAPPSKEKKPVPEFKGWYYQELAEL